MTIASTTDAYQAIANRILNYVPTGAVMPAVPLSTTIGGRLWVLAPPDNADFPCVVIKLMDRTTDGYDHGLTETFALEVQCFNRPRRFQQIASVQKIADQVQAALTDWKEPTQALTIRSMTRRQSYNAETSPADRDVIREYMVFAGFWFPTYLASEVGSS